MAWLRRPPFSTLYSVSAIVYNLMPVFSHKAIIFDQYGRLAAIFTTWSDTSSATCRHATNHHHHQTTNHQASKWWFQHLDIYIDTNNQRFYQLSYCMYNVPNRNVYLCTYWTNCVALRRLYTSPISVQIFIQSVQCHPGPAGRIVLCPLISFHTYSDSCIHIHTFVRIRPIKVQLNKV